MKDQKLRSIKKGLKSRVATVQNYKIKKNKNDAQNRIQPHILRCMKEYTE